MVQNMGESARELAQPKALTRRGGGSERKPQRDRCWREAAAWGRLAVTFPELGGCWGESARGLAQSKALTRRGGGSGRKPQRDRCWREAAAWGRLAVTFSGLGGCWGESARGLAQSKAQRGYASKSITIGRRGGGEVGVELGMLIGGQEGGVEILRKSPYSV